MRMAGGRRISRVLSTSSNSKHNNYAYPSSSPGGTALTEERHTAFLDMKHIKMPYLPRESTLTFEIILLLHITVFTSLQFLHLYRTVWWLPQSFNSSGMNFHLIDGNIIVFILALLARRIPYLILKSCIPTFSHWILQIVLTAQMLTWILLTTFHLWNELLLSTCHVIYLFGPFVFYFHIYGLSVSNLWELEEIDNPNFEGCCPGNCQNHSYHHVCTNDPIEIRDEVELLRKEFNCRMGRILCQTTFLAYYSCFLPWCFVQKYVHYDLWWVAQHLILSWMIIFSLLLSRALCPDFSDGLHKVACHLGKWTRLRPTHIPSNAWMGEYLFAPGAVVKHQRELYKAEGFFSVASEPGNCTHTRFQMLFCGSSFPRLLLGFHVSLLILCLIILVRTNEWYQVISISALLVTSLYTFIRLGRDFLVAWKMYQAEEMIIKQQQQ